MKKFYFSILFFLLTHTVAAQISANERTGNWVTGASEPSIWNGPDPCTICNNKEVITIGGTVYHYGDLLFENGANLTIESDGMSGGTYVGDTLVVMGDVSFKNTSSLVVKEGAVLVVNGNFEANNNLGVEASGSIIVAGDFTAANNAKIDNTVGMLYVGGTFDPGKNLTLSDTQKGVGNMDDLRNNDPALYNFYQQSLPAPMPVELLYFTSKTAAQGVKLEWAAAKELNFSHYTIERSENGKDFYAIHTEYAKNDNKTSKVYAYVDGQPQFGANYYRLVATDIDGSQQIKGITLAYAGTDGALKLYPNPSKGGDITLQNPGAIEGTWVSIFNASGREVIKMEMNSVELTLPEGSLSTGIYIVKVYNQLETKQTRLIVQ